jgi:hypothetical protein
MKYKGYNSTLVLTETGVIIRRGAKGYLLGGGRLRGETTIPYSAITAVQLKKAGVVAGYLQLTLPGGSSHGKGGLKRSINDENTVNFHARRNKDFAEERQKIEKRMGRGGRAPASDYDDLEKLAELRDKGVITEEDFEAKKKQVLGL